MLERRKLQEKKKLIPSKWWEKMCPWNKNRMLFKKRSQIIWAPRNLIYDSLIKNQPEGLEEDTVENTS